MRSDKEGIMRIVARSNRAMLALWIAALVALTMTIPGVSAADGNATGWEQIRSESGIVVWRKDVTGSSLVAFKGEGVIDAPLLLVGSVLVDTARSPEWVDSLKESRILRKVSESEYITYTHIKTPIVMKDRDFVTDTQLEVDPAQKKLWIKLHSVNDPLAPHTSYVRGELLNSSFELTSIDNGKRTRVVTEIHCDPKGSVADWIVNLFQKGWPYNTLQSLRAQVIKSDVAVHPRLKAVLEEKGFFN
jgi:hypothetical protein